MQWGTTRRGNKDQAHSIIYSTPWTDCGKLYITWGDQMEIQYSAQRTQKFPKKSAQFTEYCLQSGHPIGKGDYWGCFNYCKCIAIDHMDIAMLLW